jgi:hypothetical protein
VVQEHELERELELELELEQEQELEREREPEQEQEREPEQERERKREQKPEQEREPNMRHPKEFIVSSVDTDGVTIIVAIYDKVNKQIIRVEADTYETFDVPGRGLAKKKKEAIEDQRQTELPPAEEEDMVIEDAYLFEPNQ